MQHPTVMLKFNQKLDQEIAWEFYCNQKIGGCDFWKERALKYHPELFQIAPSKNPKKFLKTYISNFYRIHGAEVQKLAENTVRYFYEKQDEYFSTVNKIFNDYPWPKNEFTGYFSIFDFCPRFLSRGSFQIFIYDTKNLQLFTIFHELLHFIFYDSAKKSFPEMFKKMDTEKGKFWDLAEIFNVVIQDNDDFIKLHRKIENIGYPDHKDLITKSKDLWQKNPNLDQWIAGMMKII